MRLLIASAMIFLPCAGWAQQAPLSGAEQLLGRCTQESARMLDRITQLEAELAKMKPVAPDTSVKPAK